MKLSKIDQVSLEYILESIERALPNVQDDVLYEYLVDIINLLNDLKKRRKN
jgi:hypothetical protein